MPGRPEFPTALPLAGSPLLAELVCLCPSCLGISWEIGREQCPDCHVDLLVRSPIGMNRRALASAPGFAAGWR